MTELRDALGSDAYWKAPTWKRLVAIAAGPAANIALTIVVFTFLFMTVAGNATSIIATIAPELQPGVESPAKTIGSNPVTASSPSTAHRSTRTRSRTPLPGRKVESWC